MRTQPPDDGAAGWNAGAAVDAVKSLDLVDVAFAAKVSADRTSFVLDRFRGARTTHLNGLTSAVSSGLGGKCISIRRPVVVGDYTAARGITHEHDRPVSAEGLRSLFAVPVVRDGAVRGLVYGAARSPLVFGDRFLDMAVTTARNATAVPLPASEPQSQPLSVHDVQELFAGLREIAHELPDRALRERLLALGDRLCRSPGESPTPIVTPHLSPRELDVLAEVAIGCDNAEVASRLDLTVETVRSYLKSIMCKFGCHNRTATVYQARRAGLLP